MDLKTVKQALVQGECDGGQKYLDPSPSDIKNWQAINYHARFLLRMQKRFAQRRGGFIHGQKLTKGAINQNIQFLLKRATKPPSKKKPKIALALVGLEGLAKKPSKARPSHTSASAQSSPAKAVSAKALLKAPSKVLLNAAKHLLTKEVQPNDIDLPANKDPSIFLPIEAFSKQTIKQIKAKCADKDLKDLTYCYPRYMLLRELTQNAVDIENVEETTEDTTNVARAIVDEIAVEVNIIAAHDLGIEDIDSGNSNDKGAFPNIIPFNKLGTENPVDNAWLKELIDNPAYQRFNYIGAIKRLYIKSGRFSRLPGMLLNRTLKWWQVMGINSIINIKVKGLMRGYLLTNKVGLGKTFKIAGTILAISVIHPLSYRFFPPWCTTLPKGVLAEASLGSPCQ